MKAVVMHGFGEPEVLALEEVPDPRPGDDEVLVEVEFANITFVETQLRAGRYRDTPMSPPLPATLGTGVGGTVVALGGGVPAGLLGRRVIARTGGADGYAELATARVDEVFDVPDGLGLDEAVALMADGRTALALMRRSGPAGGEIALVEAAAGGVGSLLVQLCRNAGASVVAAAGGRRKLELARELGARIVVDYGEEDWADRVREEVERIDVAFDGVGGAIGRAAFELVARGGRLSVYGGAGGSMLDPDPQEARTRGVTVETLPRPSAEEMAELTREVLDLAATGSIRPVIGQRFGLAEAAEAHAAIESRATMGKTLLVVSQR